MNILSTERFLFEALPFQDGMERKDLLEKNCGIFKEQGELLNTVASKTVKVQNFCS